jgi:uncharacterized protein with beta-barrel porin domain
MKEFLSGLNSRKSISPIASAGTALAIILLAGQAAQADCTPAAANGVTATCSGGITNNQGAGAPGTSAGTSGYGTGVETGVGVTVSAGANTVTGTNFGINIGDGAVRIESGDTVSGAVGISGGNPGGTLFVTSLAGSTITATTGTYAIIANGRGIIDVEGTINGGSSGAIWLKGGLSSGLVLNPTSVINGIVLGTGSDALNLGGTTGGSASFDVSKLGVQYQNFGSLGAAGINNTSWTLTGTSTFAGLFVIFSGSAPVIVNGDTSSMSSTTIKAGGTLSGTGTVGNTTVNGALAPGGGTPATLNVHGSLTFSSAASYMIAVTPTAASLTNVVGTSNLGGATVNANFAAGSYVAKQYTILNATAGINGTFNPAVISNMPTLTSTLSYDANNVFLDVALLSVPTGGNGNQQAVGNALTNFFNVNGGIASDFAMLTPAGLTQAAGEGATGSQQATFSAMNQFMGIMTDPFLAGRAGGAASYAEQDGGRGAYASMSHKAAAQIYDPSWSVWAAGFGGSQTTDGNAAQGSSTATSRIFATAVGADYRFSPSTIAGFALSGGGTNFTVANGLGGGRSDLFQAGAFVRHDNGPTYISAALAYGWQGVTTDRTVTIAGVDSLHANFNANAWSGRLEGGYRYVVPSFGGLGLTPYAAAQVTAIDLPAYAEKALAGANTFALAYGSRTATDARSELGLRTDKSYAMANGVMTLRGRAAWAHDFNTDRGVTATFQALPGASFVVNGAALARDAALTTASAEMKWLNGWSTAATFEGEFSDVTRSYAGKGVVRYEW